MTVRTGPEITTVNYHLWKPCNMRCGFCFATFVDIPTSVLPKGHLGQQDSMLVVRALADAGFREINFAGGEPTLCPWLPELIGYAKGLGLVTSLVTNGTKITAEWLDRLGQNLDNGTISIDSLNPNTLLRTGRTTPAGPMSREDYLRAIRLLQERGIGTKVNTVVTRDNLEEDLTGFIAEARPDRWKLLQVLPVRGQNDLSVDRHLVSPEEFGRHIHRARSAEGHGVRLVLESNDLTTGSYVMVDPAGRFFDNTAGKHSYSQPILEVGAKQALAELSVDPGKFLARDGMYNWQNRKRHVGEPA